MLAVRCKQWKACLKSYASMGALRLQCDAFAVVAILVQRLVMQITVLIPGLIDLTLCQPLLLHQPGRYQVCIISLQTAMQQACFSIQSCALLTSSATTHSQSLTLSCLSILCDSPAICGISSVWQAKGMACLDVLHLIACVTQESELLGLSQYPCRRSTQPCQDLPKSPLRGSCAGHHHICPAPDSGSGGDHRHCRLEVGLLCIPGKAGTASALPS